MNWWHAMEAREEKGRDMMSCAMCGTLFKRDESRHVPFCSGRCQNIDLSKWLTEDYGVPYEGPERAEEKFVDSDGLENIE